MTGLPALKKLGASSVLVRAHSPPAAPRTAGKQNRFTGEGLGFGAVMDSTTAHRLGPSPASQPAADPSLPQPTSIVAHAEGVVAAVWAEHKEAARDGAAGEDIDEGVPAHHMHRQGRSASGRSHQGDSRRCQQAQHPWRSVEGDLQVVGWEGQLSATAPPLLT